MQAEVHDVQVCRETASDSANSSVSAYFCISDTHLIKFEGYADLFCFKERAITGRSTQAWHTCKMLLRSQGSKPRPEQLPQHLLSCLLPCLPKFGLHECQHLVQTTLYPGSLPGHHLEERLQIKAWNWKAFDFVSCRERNISVCVCCSVYFTLDHKLRGLYVSKPKLAT